MNVRGLKLNDLWIERLLFDLNYKFIKIGASLLALAKSIYYKKSAPASLYGTNSECILQTCRQVNKVNNAMIML